MRSGENRPGRRLGAAGVVSSLLFLGGCAGSVDRYPSPDGRHDVVISVGYASIDTVWTVSVHDSGLFGQRHDVGCFTDDDPDSASPTGVTWAGPDEFVISTSVDDRTATGDDVRVHLEPDGSTQVFQTGGDFHVPCPYS